MKTRSLLILEDEAAHAEAIRRAFVSATPATDVRVATTLREYCEEVAARPPDIALLDLNLPDGNRLEALSLVSENSPFPILVMTCMGSEEIAVTAMKTGALDYLPKSAETFAGMPRSVERDMREWDLLQAHRRAQAELRNFRAAVEQSANTIIITDTEGAIEYVNPAFEATSGYPPAEVLGRNPRILKSGSQNAAFYTPRPHDF